MDQACACCGFSWLHRNMGIAILFTCQLYRTEGLVVLMSLNRFVHLVPEREWKPDIPKCKIVVGIEYLKHLKSLALIHLDHKLVPLLVADRVDALLFLNLLLRHRVRLWSLIVCADRPENDIEDINYDLGAAEIYIPLAMRLLSEGLTKKLFIGCHARWTNDTEGVVENARWVREYRLTERDMKDIWDSLRLKSKRHQGLTVFESLEDIDEMENTVVIHAAKARNVFAMQKPDQIRMLGSVLEKWKWYGQTVEIEEREMQELENQEDVKVQEGEEFENAEKAKGLHPRYTDGAECSGQYRAVFMKPRYKLSPRDEKWRWVDSQKEEDEDELYISDEDFRDLRKTQGWWQSYLVANTPGQQKVTDWFRGITKAEWLESLPKPDMPACYRAPAARAHVLYCDASTSTQDW
jgi:hypothetical protein